MIKRDKQNINLSGAEFTVYPSLFILKNIAFGILLLTCFTGRTEAQWKKIYTFPYPDIWSIYFLPADSIPKTGFVGVGDENFSTGKTYKTTDAGFSWHIVNYIPTPPAGPPLDFSFKDSLIGWSVLSAYAHYYKTTDGGENWTTFTTLTGGDDVYFKPTNDRVYIAGYQGDIEAFDELGTTVVPKVRTSVITQGINFSNGVYGICAAGYLPKSHFIYTSNGGNSWKESPLQDGGCIQPASFKNTKNFFACSLGGYSIGNCVYRSDDAGMTWNITYHYHVPDSTFDSLTGVIREGYDTTLYIQTRPPGSEGIMRSRDGGYNFESICGPIGFHASRFFVKDTFIYAADTLGNLWLNTTGIGSNSTPQLSIANKLSFQTEACKSQDSIITITLFDSCNGLQAKLVNASISGISNFSLVAPSNSPRTIHPNDSIVVHYDPSASLSDSASLHLRFHLGWKDFDTVIQLVGTASFNPTAQLSLTKLNFPGNCTYRDSLITISCFDSCSGTSATLDSISLQGSKNFSLLAPITFPKAIHKNDSLLVRYDPLSSGSDTSILHLHFHLGAKEIDTAITLYGVRDIFPESKFSASQIKLLTTGCSSADSTITFSFFDSCSLSQAELVSASLEGSNNFSFSSPSAIPRTIHPNDSLLISYNPNSPIADTASLHLKFHLGWKDFDTTIMLTGAGRIPKENVQFIPSLSANAVSAGSSVDILIKPNKQISARALQSISFDLNYNSDLLDGGKIFSTGIPGAVITVGPEKSPSPSIPLPKLRAREVVVTGNDLSLDPNIAIADLKFMAMVTDTTSTPITISNLKLNGGDVDYQNCILSADTSGTNFTEVYLCGDSTLSKYLRTGNILTITSIHPNPAQDEVEIELHSAIKQDVSLEVFDALGVRVFSLMQNITGGSNTIHFDTKGLSAGVYLVKVGGMTQSLVISH